MKKILVAVLLVVLTFSSCEKKDLGQPEVEMFIELRGSVFMNLVEEPSGGFVSKDVADLSYTLIVETGESVYTYNVDETVNVGFNGVLSLNELKVKKGENVKISVKDNSELGVYSYLSIYQNKSYKSKLDFDGYRDVSFTVPESEYTIIKF